MFTRRLIALIAALLTTAGLALGYIQARNGSGAGLHRADFQRISYLVNDQTVAGLRNDQGELIITEDSSPVEALQAALDTWSNVPASRVQFAPLRATNLTTSSVVGTEVVFFADSPQSRSVVGGAVAVTRLFWSGDGTLVDTDVLFSPALPFSTNLTPGTFDIQSTMTHELGHALGLDHSGIASATMFALAARGSNALASLTADDRAFVSSTYPQLGGTNGATLSGTVTKKTGGALRGAHVVAQSLNTNTAIGGITNSAGEYVIKGVPGGTYVLYIEPLDGPTTQSQLGLSGVGADTSFQTTFHGGANPTTVIVFAGGSRVTDFVVDDGAAALNIEGAGAVPVGETIRSRVGAQIEPGGEYTVEVHGEGLDDPLLSESSLSFIGTGCTLVPGSFEQAGTVRFTNGEEFPKVRFRITVAANAPLGQVTLRITSETETSAYSGGFTIIEARKLPQFTSDAVVNAANFLPRGIAAGEIISIFGADLGPAEGVTGGLNPVTGRLVTLAGDVSVTINGIPLPLFFVRHDQINALAPVEIAGFTNALVVVSYKQVESAARVVPVIPTNPGVFVFPETTQAIVLNQNGTPSNGAGRGSYISLFGTGQGRIEPSLETGELAFGGANLSFFSEPVVVRIGGIEAQVTFAGMAPGFTGLFQINLILPQGVVPGTVIVEVEIGGRKSQGGVTVQVL